MPKILLMLLLALAWSIASYAATPCGTPDDTPVIQAAIDQATTQGGGRVFLPAGTCQIRSLNLTNRRAITLQGEGREATRLVPITGGVNVLDLTGSGGIVLRGFRIAGYGTTVVPTIGILLGETAAYNADAIILDSVRVDGSFSVAALYNLSIPSSAILNSQFYNYGGSGLVAIFTGNNLFGAVSQWATLDAAGHIPSDWTILASEFHSFANQAAVWLGGAQDFRVYGGNMSSSYYVVDVNAVVVGGLVVYPARIILDGTTFYSDSGQQGACAVRQQGLNAVVFRANAYSQPSLVC